MSLPSWWGSQEDPPKRDELHGDHGRAVEPDAQVLERSSGSHETVREGRRQQAVVDQIQCVGVLELLPAVPVARQVPNVVGQQVQCRERQNQPPEGAHGLRRPPAVEDQPGDGQHCQKLHRQGDPWREPGHLLRRQADAIEDDRDCQGVSPRSRCGERRDRAKVAAAARDGANESVLRPGVRCGHCPADHSVLMRSASRIAPPRRARRPRPCVRPTAVLRATHPGAPMGWSTPDVPTG